MYFYPIFIKNIRFLQENGMQSNLRNGQDLSSIADAIKTILHEAVTHTGLRQLMGDRLNEFINRVYDSLDAETKAKVDALAEKSYKGDEMVAMEEYMATLAGSPEGDRKHDCRGVRKLPYDSESGIFSFKRRARLFRSVFSEPEQNLRSTCQATSGTLCPTSRMHYRKTRVFYKVLSALCL